MEIKYKNKPTDELIERYRKMLEKFLLAHNISVSVELWDTPLYMESFVDGKTTETINIWLREIKISAPTVDGLSVSIHRQGIDENINDRDIWLDAWEIQEQFYRHLGLSPMLPPSSDDPYWKLWEHRKKME